MKKPIVPTALLCGLLLWAAGAGAAPDVRRMPGYVALDALPEAEDAQTSVEIFLRRPLLDMVAQAVRAEDAEFARVLDKLHLIQARIFEGAPGPSRALGLSVEGIIKGLAAKDWEMVVRIRENDERVDLYLKTDGEQIDGLFVAVRESASELVLVNIVGDIDPAELGRIGAKFNIEPLEGLQLDRQRGQGAADPPEGAATGGTAGADGTARAGQDR